MVAECLKSPTLPTEALFHQASDAARALRVDHGIWRIDNPPTCLLDAHGQFNILGHSMNAIASQACKYLTAEGSCGSPDDIDSVHDGVGLLEVEGEEIFEVLDG